MTCPRPPSSLVAGLPLISLLLSRPGLVSVAVVNVKMTCYNIMGLTKAHTTNSESSRKGYVGFNLHMVKMGDSQGQALGFPAAWVLQRAVVSRCMTRHTSSVETLLILPCLLHPVSSFLT